MSQVPDYLKRGRGLSYDYTERAQEPENPLLRKPIEKKPSITSLDDWRKLASKNVPKSKSDTESITAISDKLNSKSILPLSPDTKKKLESIEKERKELSEKQTKLFLEKALREKQEKLERKQQEIESELFGDSYFKKAIYTIGVMNIVAFIIYSILLIVFFVVVNPSFIYDYPEPKPEGDCKYKYCFDGACADMTSQDLRNSVREGMRKINYVKLISWFFGLWFGMIIVHFLIAKVGLLNIGTKKTRCGYKPIGC